jgi:hypothetical protein
MLISTWLTAVRNRIQRDGSHPKRRLGKKIDQSRLEESLEVRTLLAAPTLVAVRPNIGDFLEEGETRNVAPKELTLQFNPGQQIDGSNNRLFNNSPIVVTRSGRDGTFGDGNEVPVTLGYVGIGATPEEVVLRFAENLADDFYRITIRGTGPNPLRNTNNEVFNSGADDTFDFRLDLGAKVRAVVPQPITRGSNGVLTQAREQIVVYFNEDLLNEASAEDPSFYRLMSTQNTVQNTDDTLHLPISVHYDAATFSSVLTFPSDIANLGGSGTFRLRIGTNETLPLAPVTATFLETFSSSFGTTGANSATVTVDPLVSIDGNPITLNIQRAALNSNGVPTIAVAGRVITVTLDTTGGTTAAQFFWSMNLHPEASNLVRTTIAGNQNANIAVNSAATAFVFTDAGSSFGQNVNLGTLTEQSRVLNGQIRSLDYPFAFPGDGSEPGHRDIDVSIEDHLVAAPDSDAEITTLFYNFQTNYGLSPQGVALSNLITDIQKQRTREIFALYSRHLGVQFVETANLGFTIATGDLRAIDPNILTGAGGVTGHASRALGLAVMDNGETWDDSFAGSWFTTAMHQIGHLLGLGHAFDLPDLTVMGGFGGPTVQTTAAEPDFPGDADIVHGRVLYRPESRDIDLYRFELPEAGMFAAETVAERLADSSLLDTTLRLFRENADGTRELVAQNDDYFSEDSLIQLRLPAGIYFIGISASGNDQYNPAIADSGMNGTTQGQYQLRLTFRPNADSAIVDTNITSSPVQALDGDHDGVAGGEFNFWFRAVSASNQIIVDKSAPAGGTGTLTSPLREIDQAFALAQPGQIVRIVGNAGADGDINTKGDNVAYQIGVNDAGLPLVDGATMDIPRDVAVMIDAGAVLKFQDSYINAGSSSLTVDRSGASLQVLGTPFLDVTMTSWRNESIGQDTTPIPTTPNEGNWGGIIFRNDVDNDENRLNYERLGIFLNYVAHADISFGGGKLDIDSVPMIVSPITLIEARPGIYNNLITRSEDSAISADPDSFEETTFTAPGFQAVPFTPDYSRTGPDLHGNRLFNNSTNGLFVRIQTAPGAPTKSMTVSGRFDDSDIVHVVAGNLKIDGTPGGPFLEVNAPPVGIVTVTAAAGGTLSNGVYNYQLVYTDASGNESPASSATRTVTLSGANGSVSLANLPPAPVPFNGRRLYRSQNNGAGPYELVAILNSSSTTFVDDGTTLTRVLNESLAGRNRARLDASLVIDPDIIVKLEAARIEVGMGAQLIAEGSAGREIIFTSKLDDRYGAGGTFDTNNDDLLSTEAAPSRVNQVGLWGGIYLSPDASGSFDRTLVTFAGDTVAVESDFAGFNAIEAHQADLRITNSIFEENRDGTGGTAPANRFGRTFNAAGTVFARGAQPVLLNNIFRDNTGPVMTINVNALNSEFLSDYGRSRGTADIFGGFEFNQGPLVAGNLLGRNAINGMVIRGETLTTQSVWDDTDIVHVVTSTITVPNFHTYGGLRLNSDADASLVVKLQGANAGFVAGGKMLDIDDRIGGTLQIVGQPFFPVVLTSLTDDSVGSGFDLAGLPMKDTNGNGASVGVAGQWNGITITEWANDRNVEVYNERELTTETAPGTNASARNAEFLGALGKQNLRKINSDGTHTLQNAGDDNLRLGFEVHGLINAPNDVDVYSFTGEAGMEVWIDIDRTTHSLDTVVELITASGEIIALSDNSDEEQNGQLAVHKSNPLTRANSLGKSLYNSVDLYGTNQRDPGFRIILPGVAGTIGTYQVRVRSSNIDRLSPMADPADLINAEKIFDGITTGSYQLQIRLQETDEIPGTTVRYSDIRFATTGIRILGQPAHSPLIGEYSESPAANDSIGQAVNIGNILNTDRAAATIAGRISAPTDVDFYQFSVSHQDIQQIPGHTNPNRYASVVFDVDYADGMSRGNLQVHIFNAQGQLILTARDSNVSDDRSGPREGADVDDLSRGSAGALDPFIGPFELPEGTYTLAIAPHSRIPSVLNQTMVTVPTSNTIRLEPISSTTRIASEHFGGNAGFTAPRYDLYDNEQGQNLTSYHLGDVTLFVSDGGAIYTVDPFTGTTETVLGTLSAHNEIAMRPDGELYTWVFPGGNDAGASTYTLLNTGTAAETRIGDEGVLTFHDSDLTAAFAEAASNAGMFVTAFTYFGTAADEGLFVGTRGDGRYEDNLLYQFNITSGAAISQGPLRPANARATNNNVPSFFNPSGTDVVEIFELPATGTVTGIAMGAAGIFAVDTDGVLYLFDFTGNIAEQQQILDPDGNVPVLTGITAGPNQVENGLYATTLFLTDNNGVIYAIASGEGDEDFGTPLPIFVDGQTTIETGIGAVSLAFGTLQQNLWQTTGNRAADTGHGWEASPDGVRLAAPGGSSLYFGNTRGGATAGNKNNLGASGTLNNVNFPGGAHGSFVTNPFSLEGYSSTDKPTLYFNYFLETDSNDYIPGVRPMTDSFRVYVGDGTNWAMVATNNSYREVGPGNDERDFAPDGSATQFPTTQLYPDTVELYDEQIPPVWRQARIDLSSFAGLSELRLRFEFATSGSVNVGDITTVGEEFYARPGATLRDGQSYILEGVNQFELDMGHTLVVPDWKDIREGETFTIQGTVFEFDKTGDGVTGGRRAVTITNSTMSPSAIAVAMETAIDAALITNLRTYRDNNRINLMLEPPLQPISTAVAVSQSVPAGLLIDGAPGVTSGTTSVVVHAGMTRNEVAEVIAQRLADHLLPAGVYREAELNNTRGTAQNLEFLSWTDVANNTITASQTLPHISIIGTSTVGTGTDFYSFAVPGGAATRRVVIDLDGTSPTFNSIIRVLNPLGAVVAENITGPGIDIGSNHAASFLDLNLAPGNYFIQVGVPPLAGGASPAQRYTMHVSVEGHAVNANGATTPLVVDRTNIKSSGDLVRIIGHYVTNAGPMGLTTSLPGDAFGGFYAGFPQFAGSLRGMNNAVEGVYVDDIVIGFAERGEMVTGAPSNSAFIANPEVNDPANLNPYQDILEGDYDIEIRRASDYARESGFPNPQFRDFDTNERFLQAQTLIVGNSWELYDGQTFSLSDGVNSVTFEYEDASAMNGVLQGHFPILFNPRAVDAAGHRTGERAHLIAARIRDAINSTTVQGVLNVSASMSDGSADGSVPSTSNRVNIYGNALFTLQDGLQLPPATKTPLGVSGTINGLQNTIGSSALFSFVNTTPLLDPLTGFPERINSIRIKLPAGQTFDPNPIMGGTGTGPTVNAASDFDTPTFTTLDSLNPRIPVFTFNDFTDLTITFDNANETGFDLGDQLIFGLDIDFGPEPVWNLGSAVEIVFSSGRSVRAIYSASTDTAATGVLRPVEETSSVQFNDGYGDQNRVRDQGQILIHSNSITNSLNWGVIADAGARTGDLPHAGPVRNLREPNTNRLVPGVVISNNVIAGSNGILFSGDPGTGTLASVAVGRIVNNTLVGRGTGTGIQVEENSSPTLLNNIVADFTTGILVDPSAQALGTVIGATLYRGNGTNANTGGIGLGTFPMTLTTAEPLFVDQANGNFYPAPLSRAIDSSIDSLGDRTALVTVKNPLGLAVSPLLTPTRDVFGQVRGDDPDVVTPAAQGANVFKDRGAIDRVDFFRPTGKLTAPLDDSTEDLDADPNNVWLNEPETLREIIVSLSDVGIGVDDNRIQVSGSQFRLFMDDGVRQPSDLPSSTEGLLIPGVDYQFVYNSTTNEVIFRSTTAFPFERKYRIVVDNDNAATDGVDGVRDLAGNYLAPNQTDGTTQFFLLITDGVNDPPENSYPLNVSFDEDTTKTFSGADRISVSDPDVWLGTNRLQVSLKAVNGVLSLSGTTGLTMLMGSGTNDVEVRFEGLVSDINAALDGLQFIPDADYFGPAQIEMLTNDLGGFSGPPSAPPAAETDFDTILLTVNPVNDAPNFTIPALAQVTENEADAGKVLATFVSGIDAGAANETPPQNVTVESIRVTQILSGPWTTTNFFVMDPVTMEPEISLDLLTGDLFFRTNPDVNGSAVIEITLTDDDVNDPRSTTLSFTLTVDPINDAPVFTTNIVTDAPGDNGTGNLAIDAAGNITIDEDAGRVLTAPVTVDFINQFAPARSTALDEIDLPQTTTWSVSSPINLPGVAGGNLVFTQFVVDVNGNITFQTAQNTAGSATFTLTLQDNGGTLNGGVDLLTRTFTINVRQINDAPVAVSADNYFADEGFSVTLNASASTDPDLVFGDSLTYEWDLNSDDTFDFSGVSPTITWTQLANLGLTAPAVYTIRLRVTDQAGLTSIDTATLTTQIVDYGDAPNTYGTLRASGGAAHTINGTLFLGASIDKEPTGQPTANANGDGADEDGVLFPTSIEAAATNNLPFYIDVISSAAGRVDVWLDLNRNGQFNHATEHLGGGVSSSVVAGRNRLFFTIPAGTTPGDSMMRVRLSSAGSLQPTGRANDGEVEDYAVKIKPLQTAVTPTFIRPFDFNLGDGRIPQTSDLTPPVAWLQLEQNYEYDLVVRNASNAIVFTVTGTTETAFNMPALSAGIYTATVTAFNKLNIAAAPATWQFQVVPLVVSSPSGNVLTPRPTINWNHVEGTKTYHVELESLTTGTQTFFTIDATTATPPNRLVLSNDLPLGQYRVRVRATDMVDLQGDWSPLVTFAVRTPVTITAPVGSITNQRPQITWNAVPGAVRYSVSLFNVTDNVSAASVSNVLTTNWTPPTNLSLAQYRVEILAFNSVNESSLPHATYSFTVAPVPVVNAPTGRLPDSTPTFSWNPIAGADTYELIVTQAFGTMSEVFRVSNLTGTQFTQTTPMPLGRYTYQVRGRNNPAVGSSGNAVLSSLSAVTPFTVTERVTVTNPLATTFDSQPVITWTAPIGSSPTMVNSEVWVNQIKRNSAGQAFQENVFTKTAVSGNSLDVGDVRDGNNVPINLQLGTYVVWVRTYSTVDPATVSEWSIAKTFRVTTIPTLIGVTGRTTDATPTLNWQGVQGGQTYRVYVSSLSTNTVVYNVGGLNTLNYTIPANLPLGRYRYWVQATSAFGDLSAWSLGMDFQVVTAPTLSGPSSSTFNTKPSFTWPSCPVLRFMISEWTACCQRACSRTSSLHKV